MVRKIHTLFIALIALAIAIGMLGTEAWTTSTATRHPVRTIKITFESAAREKFVEHVRSFAESQAFEIRVRQRSPDPDDTFIQMRRQDAELLVVRVRTSQPQELRYDVGIYANGEQPLPIDTVGQLVEILRATVEAVPIATFTITK
jgi:hypothetical protein